MTEHSVVISDPYRVPIIAQKRTDADKGVVLRGLFHHVVVLSDDELDRLISFARNEPRIQRYPISR